MAKKREGRWRKIDRYLWRNSYFYKWGKLLLKSRLGRSLVLVLLAAFLIYSGVRLYERNQIKEFVQHWPEYLNHGDFQGFMACIDTSPANPYRLLFPDWRQFFESGLRWRLEKVSVRRTSAHLFEVRADISFLAGGKVVNRFRGELLVRREGKCRIVRVEI